MLSFNLDHGKLMNTRVVASILLCRGNSPTVVHSLNVVIGANGTGKSTILNAICLGLGGDPNLLGRAHDARDYVMNGETKAEIEIDLVAEEGETPHTLRRVIDRNKGSENGNGRGASTFYINDEKVKVKAVQQLVTETYGIQIGNLCTFLPQDKVGNFSAIKPQELLLETEKTLSQEQYFYNTVCLDGGDASLSSAHSHGL